MTLNDPDVEFTFEDTYDHLKDLKSERVQEVKELMNIVKNNEVKTLGSNVTPEEIRQKRLKFIHSFEKFVAQEQPKDLPIPNTPDFYADALKGLEDEVYAMEELLITTDEELKEIQSDIAYMEKKRTAFEQMKEASLTAAESDSTINYEAAMVVTKRIFQEVKADLESVVDILFPDHPGFEDLLHILTRALSKGGDDLYISVKSECLQFAYFLEESDIVQFHPNDKTKIKLREL